MFNPRYGNYVIVLPQLSSVFSELCGKSKLLRTGLTVSPNRRLPQENYSKGANGTIKYDVDKLKKKSVERILPLLPPVIYFCLLGTIVYHGKYFPDLFSGFYTPLDITAVTAVWLSMCALCTAVSYVLPKRGNRARESKFIFDLHLFCFSVGLIAKYCFAAYVLASFAMVSAIAFSLWFAVDLCKNGSTAMAVVIVVYILFLCLCLYVCLLDCALVYGRWKD